MPTYVYRREDGSTFEIEQRITEDALQTCPETGQKVERVITGSAGLIFKGSGFYLTDYVRGNGNGKASKGTADTKASTEPAASSTGASAKAADSSSSPSAASDE